MKEVSDVCVFVYVYIYIYNYVYVSIYILVFVRLFEQAEQHSFVPPIMMIERNFTCSNKKTNIDKNSFQRNSWTFGSPACQKI